MLGNKNGGGCPGRRGRSRYRLDRLRRRSMRRNWRRRAKRCLGALGGECGKCGAWSVGEVPRGRGYREIGLEESVAGEDCYSADVQGLVGRRNGGGRGEEAAVDWRRRGDGRTRN